MDHELYDRLDKLIRARNTGNIQSLSRKLNITPRQVNEMIRCLREKSRAPVLFNKTLQTYIYTEDGGCDFVFKKYNREQLIKQINDILNKGFLFIAFITSSLGI